MWKRTYFLFYDADVAEENPRQEIGKENEQDHDAVEEDQEIEFEGG